MSKKVVVGPDLTPDWLRKRRRIMGEIDDQLIRGLEELGKGLTLDQLQLAVEHRNSFEVANIYTVTINRAHTLPKMIQSGHYDWANDDITPEHFPIVGEGVVEAKLELIHFNRPMDPEDVLKEFAKAGLEPAKIEHLLAFGAEYPEEQRKFPIIALGSVWQDRFDRPHVPGLWGDSRERGLGLDYFGYRWVGFCRFLALRK